MDRKSCNKRNRSIVYLHCAHKGWKVGKRDEKKNNSSRLLPERYVYKSI